MKHHQNGSIEIEFEALPEDARYVYETFVKHCVSVMTREHALFVRQLRVEMGYSWRTIARDCRAQLLGTWLPLSNQLAGIAICFVAADVLGEDIGDEQWN